MERKEFIKTCGFACCGSIIAGLLLESCGSTKMISAEIQNTDLIVPISSFLIKENKYRSYLVVHNEKLSYPVCVYRINENEYAALFMRCPHQGAELQVFGDKLQCPAHGSEFNDKGMVMNGPADSNLRTLPVTIQNNQLNISLK